MAIGRQKVLGPIDLLVNNTGFAGRSGPVRETDVDTWWRVMEVNLWGTVLCVQAVLAGMTSRRKGRIINTSSGVSLGPWRHVSAYPVSKAAINRFTENLALETADNNIALFVLDPVML